jgi:putative sterol carrier protein
MSALASAADLYAIVNRMIAQLDASESLKKKIWSPISLGCTVTDLGAEFVISFSKDKISGGPGSTAEATVSISLNAKTLDDIFSGKQDAQSAYMYGSLILRGSESVAEGMLYYMGDVAAAYNAAKAG